MSDGLRRVPLVILGAGGIGKTLLRQLLQQRNHLRLHHALELPVVAIAGSQSMLVGEPCLDPETLEAVCELGMSGAARYRRALEDDQIGVISTLRERGFKSGIIVDLTASDQTAEVLVDACRQGHDVVMANKRPMSSAMSIWYDLTSSRKLGRSVRYEATVGAGLPVIGTLQSLVDTGDEIVSIDACLSGTLNYLCTALEDGQAFSEAVRSARSMGITEPDPRDDLCGLDVARKALILTRMVGVRAELNEVARESLVPDHLMGASLPEFLEGLSSIDESMRARQQAADEQGLVLRYLVEIKPGKTRVGLVPVPQATPLGRLRGTDNMVSFRTARYSERTLIVMGPGAGREVTAAAVFADILQIATLAKDS